MNRAPTYNWNWKSVPQVNNTKPPPYRVLWQKPDGDIMISNFDAEQDAVVEFNRVVHEGADARKWVVLVDVFNNHRIMRPWNQQSWIKAGSPTQ